jgi:hypothetical protein
MDEGANVRSGGMGEQDEREGRYVSGADGSVRFFDMEMLQEARVRLAQLPARAGDVLLNLLQLLRVEALVPAHVHEHLDAAIELQQRLRRRRRRLRAQQRREGKHGAGSA